VRFSFFSLLIKLTIFKCSVVPFTVGLLLALSFSLANREMFEIQLEALFHYLPFSQAKSLKVHLHLLAVLLRNLNHVALIYLANQLIFLFLWVMVDHWMRLIHKESPSAASLTPLFL
jgi:hypothetical protein